MIDKAGLCIFCNRAVDLTDKRGNDNIVKKKYILEVLSNKTMR